VRLGLPLEGLACTRWTDDPSFHVPASLREGVGSSARPMRSTTTPS